MKIKIIKNNREINDDMMGELCEWIVKLDGKINILRLVCFELFIL